MYSKENMITIVKRIREERELELSDNEIYQKLKEEYKNKEILAHLIASEAKHKNFEICSKRILLLIILICIFSITSIIKFITDIDNGVQFQYSIPCIFFSMIILINITIILKNRRNSYRGLIYYSLMFILVSVLSFKDPASMQNIILSLINMAFCFIFITFSLNITPVLFPNFPLEKDKNGDYVFKD